jgi:hypothetical protein
MLLKKESNMYRIDFLDINYNQLLLSCSLMEIRDVKYMSQYFYLNTGTKTY